MAHVIKGTVAAQRKHSSDIEKCLDGCKEKFNQILFGVLNEGNQDAHKIEASIFRCSSANTLIMNRCKI